MQSNAFACAHNAALNHLVRRPLLRYYGGKFRNADKIIRHFPSRYRVYVEPFGGGASVLLKKPRSYAEVYNDLDQNIVNLFQVMRDPVKAQRLIEAVHLTPFARDEFYLSYQEVDDPIEQARRTLVRSFMGYSSSGTTRTARTGFRCSPSRHHADDWNSLAKSLLPVIERLRGVIIENRDAHQVIAQYDSPQTLFYVDPPYLFNVRGDKSRKNYRHELSNDDHVALAKTLNQLEGYVVLSGYDSELYRDLYAEWSNVTWRDYAMCAHPRHEVLWLSPNIAQADLFSMAKSVGQR